LPESIIPQELLCGTGWASFNPEGYRGPSAWTTSGSARIGFFEGWYYKLTQREEHVVLIAGTLLSKSATPEDSFAFLMLDDPTPTLPPGAAAQAPDRQLPCPYL